MECGINKTWNVASQELASPHRNLLMWPIAMEILDLTSTLPYHWINVLKLVLVTLLLCCRNMDRKIGIMSRTFMAAPVVAARGGGALIGVVCMQNKMGDRDAYFDKHDENLITQCAGSIAEELADRFSELLLVGEQLVNTALYVSSDTTEDHLKNFRHMRGQYVMPTASSEQYAKDTAEMLAALDLREHSANFNLGDSPEERKSLRMKHLRRDVYSKDIVA